MEAYTQIFSLSQFAVQHYSAASLKSSRLQSKERCAIPSFLTYYAYYNILEYTFGQQNGGAIAFCFHDLHCTFIRIQFCAVLWTRSCALFHYLLRIQDFNGPRRKSILQHKRFKSQATVCDLVWIIICILAASYD